MSSRSLSSQAQVVDMGSAILRAPNEIAIGQNTNHHDITKFSDTDDTNYRPVLTKLLNFGDDISKKLVQATKALCLSEDDTVEDDVGTRETSR